jgi:hypothetical protein
MTTKPDHEAIAVRAFFIWQQRGCAEGDDLRDWLIAEMEILHGWDKLPARKGLLPSPFAPFWP